ncbi:hypothetical protein OROMI_010136 [Orobanche minor]
MSGSGRNRRSSRSTPRPERETEAARVSRLFSGLRQCLPANNRRRGADQPVSEADQAHVLQESADYIRSLDQQANDLSNRLSQIPRDTLEQRLATLDPNSVEAQTITNFLYGGT